MTKRLSFLGLVLLLSLALPAAWAAPADWFPPARLFADDGGRNDLFGSAIAPVSYTHLTCDCHLTVKEGANEVLELWS